MFVQFKETYPCFFLLIKKIKPKKKKCYIEQGSGLVPVNTDSTASVTAKGADMKRSHISSEHLCWFELVASVYRF